MKTTTKKELKLKSGTVIPAGAEIDVMVPQDRPTVAVVDYGSGKFKIKTALLSAISDSFIKPTEKMLDGYLEKGSCPSMAGETVEVDGWDEHGMPSVLMALGYV